MPILVVLDILIEESAGQEDITIVVAVSIFGSEISVIPRLLTEKFATESNVVKSKELTKGILPMDKLFAASRFSVNDDSNGILPKLKFDPTLVKLEISKDDKDGQFPIFKFSAYFRFGNNNEDIFVLFNSNSPCS